MAQTDAKKRIQNRDMLRAEGRVFKGGLGTQI